MKDEPFTVILAEFENEEAASQALNNLKAERKERSFTLKDTVIIRKDPNGKLHIKETDDSGGGKGAGFGLLAGAALGLIGGPLGIAAWGAAGALVGGIAAKLHDSGIQNDQLRQIGEELTLGGSALVIVIDPDWTTPIEKDLVQSGGQVFTTGIAAEIAAQIQRIAEEKQAEVESFVPVASSAVLQSPTRIGEQAKSNMDSEQ